MSRDPYIRLTYMIFDGNRKGIFGRLQIPNDSSYRNLIGLDLLELLHKEITWDRRSRDVRFYKTSLTEQGAKGLIRQQIYDGIDTTRLAFLPVELFTKLDSYWVESPPSHDQVHLLVEILPEYWSNPEFEFF
ncbi:hypothetical protein FRC12_012525 [Ceratobasidium sp. 428]|nr:hypothetical protein FRC12_012525 [Ceratobasidium sp. 428]